MDSLRVQRNIRRIEVNDDGECIVLNFDDQELPDKFFAMQGRYEAKRKEVLARESEIRGSEDEKSALYDLATEFSRFCVEQVDGLIGAGSCRKIFGADVPAFELFGELFEALAPYFEDGFKARAARITKYSAARTGNV